MCFWKKLFESVILIWKLIKIDKIAKCVRIESEREREREIELRIGNLEREREREGEWEIEQLGGFAVKYHTVKCTKQFSVWPKQFCEDIITCGWFITNDVATYGSSKIWTVVSLEWIDFKKKAERVILRPMDQVANRIQSDRFRAWYQTTTY